MTFSHWAKQIASAFGSDNLRKNFFILFAAALVVLPARLLARDHEAFNEREYTSSNIKTVRFHRVGEPMSYPIIALNSNQQLVLSFDEAGTTIRDYYFSIELCDADWQSSGLMRTEYYRGEERLPVREYKRSFNTTFDYVHYQLTFPDVGTSLLRSGNYLLRVFQDYDDEEPVIVRRFMVSEQKVRIEPDISYTMQSAGRGNYQEIDFEVFHPGMNIQDPSNEVQVTVMQNNRTDNAITGVKPMFSGEDHLDFNYNGEIVFEGGNEFRWIDLRSFRFQSDHVENIEFSDPFYHVDVFTDRPRVDRPYRYHRDYNGQFYIDVQEEQNPAVSADYGFVHFSLKSPRSSDGQEVYLIGGLTNWQCNEKNLMDYDHDKELYTHTLLLKQGYYNYQYLIKEEDVARGSLMPIEGSFGRTENDYLILVYYRPPGGRYDRLLGTQVFNSANR